MALLLASCENVIKYEYDKNDGRITILSAMSTLDSSHDVYLSWSYPDRVAAIPGASVVCTINGVEHKAVEYIPTEDEQSGYYGMRTVTKYTFDAIFKPGDEVRIEASKDGKKAWTELTVPQKPILTQVDTQTVVRTMHYQDLFDTSTYEEEYLDVTSKIRDIAGEDNYYTLNCSKRLDFTFYVRDEESDELKTTKDLFVTDLSFVTFNDRILEDGYASQRGTLLEELLPTNEMHGFSDKEFKDGEATLKFSVESYSLNDFYNYYFYPVGVSRALAKATMQVRLSTISRDYYNYLRALNNMMTYGYDVSIIIEPTMLPNNVTNGYGMVVVRSEEVVSFDMGETEYDLNYYGPVYDE